MKRKWVAAVRRSKTKRFSVLLLIVTVGIVSTISVHAAISAISLEAESGATSGGASVVSDAQASGGSAVAFNTTSSDPYADVASNFNVNDWLINEVIPEDNSWEPTGNFRFICTFSNLGYVDPVVYPGQANKGHLHMFFGNKSIDQNSTYQSLRSSGDGSCPGGPLNRTGYWMPAVFDANDGNKVVVPSYFNVYYKDSPCPYAATNLSQKQNCIRQTSELPNGLRIIAGHDMNAGDSQPQTHAWYCSVTQGSKPTTMPTSCPPGEDLIGAVYFPTCWDGVNLDSPDHRSHMAYIYYDPNDGQSRCPSTHPVHVPALTEFAVWENPGNISGWSLSSDHMPGMTHARGSTFHADWFGAWDNATELAWIENCIRGMRNSNSGNLCNGKALKPIQNYSGPMRISGYTDYYK